MSTNRTAMVTVTANLRPWQPARAAIPRGRPKRDHDVAELARTHTAAAISALAKMMTDRDASPVARVGAATALLDRGRRKPLQHGSFEVHTSIADEFEALVRQLGSNSSPPMSYRQILVTADPVRRRLEAADRQLARYRDDSSLRAEATLSAWIIQFHLWV